MGTYSETEWVRPEDRQWGDALQWRLALEHPAASREMIERVLVEAQEACTETGLPARELFGGAEAYADEVASERIREEDRAAVDMDGAHPADQLQGVLLAVGFTGTILSLLLLMTQGKAVEVFPWQLVLQSAGTVTLGAAVGGLLARRAGQIRRSWLLAALAVGALGVGGVFALRLADSAPLGELSTIVPLLAYVAMFVLGWNMPARRHPHPQQDSPPEKWFSQLNGLLRGRYYVARATASGYEAEARTTWRESGAAHPQDVLGSPQLYALQLVDGSVQPFHGQRLFLAWAATAVAALWLVITAVYVWTGVEPGIWRWFATVFFLAGAVQAWRRVPRERHKGSGSLGV